MKQKSFKFPFLFLTAVLFCFNPIFGQQARLSPFSIESSYLFEEMQKIKSSNPKITPEEFANQANSLLRSKGMNFAFAFDANTCRQITELKQKQKDPKMPLKLNAKMNSVDGEIASVTLPEVMFDNRECGKCYVLLPILQFTSKEFVTIIQDRNIRFYTPSNLIYNEVSLMDGKNFSSKIRSWKIPFRGVPLSISEDDKMIVLDLNNKEFSDIVLTIYEEGVFQFFPKKDLDLSIKGTILNEIPKDSGSSDTSFISFIRGENKQILKFGSSCQ